ncbi:MAG: STAS domain-containing protein [Tardiphaga sp.]|nr:STAS domain-containing protein [Tardiphaga sp.]
MRAYTTAVTSDQPLRGSSAAARESGETVHKLAAVIDLTHANDLRHSMVALLADRSLLLDASAVQRMSTPGVQILLAAGRAADLANCPFQIIDASEVFLTALSDLGLQGEFKKWIV